MKPENILLNDEMHIQITDFGSAKILKKESEAINSTGKENFLVGIMRYNMSDLVV